MNGMEYLRSTIEGKEVTVFTINGYQIHGTAAKVLEDMLVIQEGGQEKAIMKSAISTVIPGNARTQVNKR